MDIGSRLPNRPKRTLLDSPDGRVFMDMPMGVQILLHFAILIVMLWSCFFRYAKISTSDIS